MRKIFAFALFIIWAMNISSSDYLYAQCPTSSFTTSKSTYCINENIELTNASTDADSYSWDFCSGSIENIDQVQSIATVSDLQNAFGMSVVIDDNEVSHAFVTSWGNDKVFRIDTVTNYSIAPNIVDLGVIADKISGIDIIKEAANWYGIASTADGLLYRLSFGSNLASIPTPTLLTGLTAVTDSREIKIVKEGSDYYAANVGGNSLQMIKFTGTITDNSPTELVSTITGANLASDIDLIKECGNWYGIYASALGGTYHLSFTSGIFNAPTSTKNTDLGNGGGAEIIYEAGKYYAFVTDTDSNNLHRLDFGTSMALPATETNLGYGGSVAVSTSLDIINQKGDIHAIFNGAINDQIYQVSFTRNCTLFSTEETPTDMTYSADGSYDITLYAHDDDGNTISSTQSITITSDTAPNIDFSVDNNECLGQPNNFTAIDGGGVTYEWSFDGGNTVGNTSQNPAHTFSQAGDSIVVLTVNDGTCTNFAKDTVSIFPVPPTPSYTFVNPGVLCTNNSIDFTNTSDESNHSGATLTYSWDYNSEGNSADKNGIYTFTSEGSKNVELTMSIPGCSSQTDQDLTLVAGPSVNFSYTNNCFGQAIQFNDASTGAGITGYSWNFGDGSGSSILQNPTYTYAAGGDYNVTLTVTNGSGCANQHVVPLTVSNNAKTDFTFGSAVENLATSFTGQDLTIADDDIVDWSWDFDGLGNSNLQNPSFTFSTPGDFNVTLDITTSQGCSESVQKNVSVAEASCPTSSFTTSKSTYCINENIELTNASANADSYSWDFCSGSIENIDQVQSTVTVNDLTTSSFDLSVVIDDNEVSHAFVTSWGNDKVFRIDTVTNYSIAPNIVDLGVIADKISGIDIIKEAANWYGIASTTDGLLYRLSFGPNLASIPTPALINGLTAVTNSRGIKIVKEGSDYYVANAGGNSLQMIKFTGTITDNSPTELVSTITGASFASDVDLIKECGSWYGIYASALGGTYHLSFTNGLFDAPVSTKNTDLGDGGGGAEIIFEAGKYYAFVTDINSFDLHRLDFGTSMALPAAETNLGYGGGLGLSTSLGILNQKGDIHAIFNGLSDDKIYEASFIKNCNLFSTEGTPTDMTYAAAGSYDITLYAHDNDGNTVSSTQSITITSNTAPNIDFSVDNNECLGQPNNFTAIDGGGVTYEWSFDGGNTVGNTSQNPAHTFSQAGDSIVVLTVNDGTCTNFAKDTVSIFPVPLTPTFNVPPAPLCTEASLAFTNNFNEAGYEDTSLTYSWDFNGEGNSATRDGSFTFNSEGTKTITLTVSIPGCSTSSPGTDINLIAGPTVNFSYGDKCLGDNTQFTNLSTGTGITGQTWDFGDMNGTTDLSPSHEYQAAGNFNVSLTVDNAAGCSNVLVIPLTIDDRPNADFNMGVGCEGQVVGFEDQSSVASANIESYTWDFGGQGSSSQEDPLFIFETQGTYPIKLTVESTFGCTDEATKNLNVQLAPVAAFDIDLGCMDAATQFTDRTDSEAENPINIWYWDINGDIIPNTQNPQEIFDTPGDYTATLTVTPSNLCTSTISKNFTIHELPVANFTVNNTCDNEFTSFADASSSATTSIVTYNWQFGEEGTGNSNPAVFNFDQAGNYDVGLTVIDDIGCEGTSQQTITINASPTAAFEVSTNIGPAPLAIDFMNKSQGASSYLWKFNESDETTSSEINPTFAYTELGEYITELVAINDMGCRDTTSLPITAAEPILDLELLQISKEESQGKTTLNLTIKNSGNVTINNFDIRIDLDNNSSIYESFEGTLLRNQVISYSLNLTFAASNNNIGYTCISIVELDEAYEDVNIVNNEACIDFDQKLIVENSYPNPANSQTSNVRLNMILPTQAPIQIFLLDATGSVLYQDIYSDTTEGLNSFFIDIYSYDQGIYFIKVIYDGIESTQRFVKL